MQYVTRLAFCGSSRSAGPRDDAGATASVAVGRHRRSEPASTGNAAPVMNDASSEHSQPRSPSSAYSTTAFLVSPGCLLARRRSGAHRPRRPPDRRCPGDHPGPCLPSDRPWNATLSSGHAGDHGGRDRRTGSGRPVAGRDREVGTLGGGGGNGTRSRPPRPRSAAIRCAATRSARAPAGAVACSSCADAARIGRRWRPATW